jgi:hypothetical protein
VRNSLWPKIVCIVWLVALIVHKPVLAESVAGEILKLCNEAVASGDMVTASEKLDQAEDLLEKSSGKLDKLEYDFQYNEIMQKRGLVCISLWQSNHKDPTLREKGRRWLLKVIDNYDRLAKKCEEDADSIEKRLSGPTLNRNQRYKTVVGNISRANYKSAWTRYLLGISSENPDEREAHLKKALSKFLNLTANGYRNDPIVADCFIGRARCLYELQRYFDVTELLDSDKITVSNTTSSVYMRMTELLIKACQGRLDHLIA